VKIVGRKIKNIGEKRVDLSIVFRIRNDMITAIRFDDEELYNNSLDALQNIVMALTSAGE
jgi:hypothetical protein